MSTFLTYYVDIAIFVLLWVVAFWFQRSGVIKLRDIDLSEMADVEREKAEILVSPVRNLPWWRKWII